MKKIKLFVFKKKLLCVKCLMVKNEQTKRRLSENKLVIVN